eukprot:Rmarinus@m.15107
MRLWEVTTGRCLRTMRTRHAPLSPSICVDPTGLSPLLAQRTRWGPGTSRAAPEGSHQAPQVSAVGSTTGSSGTESGRSGYPAAQPGGECSPSPGSEETNKAASCFGIRADLLAEDLRDDVPIVPCGECGLCGNPLDVDFATPGIPWAAVMCARVPAACLERSEDKRMPLPPFVPYGCIEVWNLSSAQLLLRYSPHFHLTDALVATVGRPDRVSALVFPPPDGPLRIDPPKPTAAVPDPRPLASDVGGSCLTKTNEASLEASVANAATSGTEPAPPVADSQPTELGGSLITMNVCPPAPLIVYSVFANADLNSREVFVVDPVGGRHPSVQFVDHRFARDVPLEGLDSGITAGSVEGAEIHTTEPTGSTKASEGNESGGQHSTFKVAGMEPLPSPALTSDDDSDQAVSGGSTALVVSPIPSPSLAPVRSPALPPQVPPASPPLSPSATFALSPSISPWLQPMLALSPPIPPAIDLIRGPPMPAGLSRSIFRFPPPPDAQSQHEEPHSSRQS